MLSFFYHIAIDLYPDRSSHGVQGRDTGCPGSATPIPTNSTPLPDPFSIFSHTRSIEKPESSCLRSSDYRLKPYRGRNSKTGSPLEKSPHPHRQVDYRYGRIMTSGVTTKSMVAPTASKPVSSSGEDGISSTKGIRGTGSGLATKGRYEPLEDPEHEVGWGLVRLFREGEETPGLYDDLEHGKPSKHTRTSYTGEGKGRPSFMDEDCTTLCILAVPSYLTPSDFLGFVGEKTREKVSHFRMIRTEKSNRYMVLMKFRHGKDARLWRREWNGASFDDVQVWVVFLSFRGHADIPTA